MRRVHRQPLHKHSNKVRVDGYSTRLGEILDTWLEAIESRGFHLASLLTALDRAAAEWFPQAFANGRHQAYPKRRPTPAGREVLVAKLLSNRHFLENSLGPDIEARVAAWKPEEGTLSDTLRKAFRSRIVQQYGGAIWAVTEAGYRAGLQQASHDLAVRLTGHLMADEGDDEEPGDAELAIALGITVVALLLLIRSGRERAQLTPSPDISAVGLGGPPTGAVAQIIPLPGTLDRAGIRIGLAYEAEADACEVCAELATAGEDGDGIYWEPDQPPLPGDDCLGMNNCRCTLSTVVDAQPVLDAASEVA